MKKLYKFSEKVWLYPGETAQWHFVTIPKKESREIKDRFKGISRGFGSVPVEVMLGITTWKTSIFPDKRSGTYFLPLKASVRKVEDIEAGDIVDFSLKF